MISPLSRWRDSSPRGGTKEFHLFLSSCLPLGEGAERSEAEGGCASQLNIVSVRSNFLTQISCGTRTKCQNSRYAKNLC